jgi:enoyl-CoA hydratase
MSDHLVLRTDSGGVSTLTLNRPEKLNALSRGLFEQLRQHVDEIAGDDSVGCVVMTGAGRSFSAGLDLTAARADGQAFSATFAAETIDALEALPQPTVGMIRGHCLTGGLELALACDLLICAQSAKFGDTHGRWGLVPVWGMSVRLPERVGRLRAKELMFTGRTIDGAAAASIALANRCVPDEQLDTVVAALAAEVVANSWGTNRIDKLLVGSSRDLPRQEALQHERTLPFGVPEDGRARRANPRQDPSGATTA